MEISMGYSNSWMVYSQGISEIWTGGSPMTLETTPMCLCLIHSRHKFVVSLRKIIVSRLIVGFKSSCFAANLPSFLLFRLPAASSWQTYIGRVQNPVTFFSTGCFIGFPQWIVVMPDTTIGSIYPPIIIHQHVFWTLLIHSGTPKRCIYIL